MKRNVGLGSLLSSVVLAFGALSIGSLALVAPASAVIARVRQGHVVSYQPTVAQVKAARGLERAFGPLPARGGAAAPAPASTAPTRTAGAYKQCTRFEAACLSYYGGPVMRTTTLTPIFWNPEGLGLEYPTGFVAEVEQFFTGLAADSGAESNFFSLLTQYADTGGRIQYAVTAGSAVEDESKVPLADKCVYPLNAAEPCVDDAGIQGEVENAIAKGGLPRGRGHEYVVFLPDGLQTCFGAGGVTEEALSECSGTAFCAYHSAIGIGSPTTTVEYANEPENGQYGLGCTAKPGLKAGYVTLSSTSHEISESVTDPEPSEPKPGEPLVSWYDFNEVEGSVFEESQYAEIGDMCAYEYEQGEAAGKLYREEISEPAGTSNQTIGGHPYLLQGEWDNAHSACSVSARASSTKASFTVSAANAQTGVPVSVDGSGSQAPIDPYRPVSIASYTYSWGDGTQTTSASPVAEHAYASTQGAASRAYGVTLTVTDTNGNTASSAATVTVGDRAPTAAISPPAGLQAGSAATFSGAASTDPDGAIAGYSWSFGDGTPTQTGATPAHTFGAPGAYTVTLTVTDDAGQTATSSIPVTAAAPPNAVRFTHVKQNKDGSLDVGVIVPAPGVLSARDGRTGIFARLAAALAAKAKHKHRKHGHKALVAFVSPVSSSVAAPGEVTLHLTLTAAGRRELAAKHSLALSVLYTFAPTGGTPASVKRSYVEKAAKAAKRRHKKRKHR